MQQQSCRREKLSGSEKDVYRTALLANNEAINNFCWKLRRTMDREQLGLGREPFAEPPDPDIFFQEAGRTSLLRAVYADLQRGAAVIRLAGAEGTGKTLLCLLLTRRLPAGFQVIYLASPGGSFDELVQAVGAEFGLEGKEDVLAALLEQHRRQEKTVLLIIDEAEKMFPAALERLLRAAFAAEGEQVLQVILAGRPALNDHLAQLAAHCPDMDIQSGHLLEPLTEAETEEYLAFRLKAAGMTAADSRAVFSGGSVRRLFEQAGGNLRRLHSLADQALRRAGQELPVLAAHVSSQSDAKEGKTPLISLGRVLKASAAGTALVLLAALLLLHNNDVRRGEQAEPAKAELPVPVQGPPGAGLKHDVPPSESSAKQTAAEPEKGHAEPVELFPAAKPADVPPEPVPSEEPSEQEQDKLPVPSDASVPAAAAEEGTPFPAQEQESVSETDTLPAEPLYTPPPSPAEEPEQPLAVPQPKKIVQLAPGKRKTRPPEKKAEQQPTSSAPEPAAAAPDADRLYQELLTAGSRLESRPHSGRYTIQLLTLSSPDAVAQLKEMIVRDEYAEHKDMLQILRGKKPPAGLLVFYGSYASMEEAKAALDNMPLFLRKHHPYVLPVDGALEKTAD